MKAGDGGQLRARRLGARVGLLDRRQQQRPALDEELVEDLVLGAEVVVDEAVGDPGLVGDVGDAGRVEALAGEDADRRVEDVAAFVDRRRLCRPSGVHLRELRPGVGLGPAVGERGQRLAHLAPGPRGRGRRRRSTPRRGRWRAPLPQGSTIAEWPKESKCGGASPAWLGARTKTWFSIARARSSTSQWSRPVVGVKAEGTVISRAPRRARIRKSSGKRRS